MKKLLIIYLVMITTLNLRAQENHIVGTWIEQDAAWILDGSSVDRIWTFNADGTITKKIKGQMTLPIGGIRCTFDLTQTRTCEKWRLNGNELISEAIPLKITVDAIDYQQYGNYTAAQKQKINAALPAFKRKIVNECVQDWNSNHVGKKERFSIISYSPAKMTLRADGGVLPFVRDVSKMTPAQKAKYEQEMKEYNNRREAEEKARREAEEKARIEASIKVYEVKGVKFAMVSIEGGTFKMGSESDESDENEKPIHEVTLNDFAIGQTEVTQELWDAVMGKNPSEFKGEKLPVGGVSWKDCQKFIKKLNKLTDQQFRLPTEAEWEYAARGGKYSKGYKFSGSDNIKEVAWFEFNSNSKTHEVATKASNELGIYDMSGNVWEWCQDWYDYYYYSRSPISNPTGPTSGEKRVGRGGCWDVNATSCRVALRAFNPPADPDSSDGFRLAQ